MINIVNNYLNGNRFNQLEFGNIQTANFNLEINKINLVDTSLSLSGLNAMIPIGLIPGTKINITDAKNSFSLEKPLIILNNGYRINGVVDDFQIPIGKSSITFIAIDDGGTELNWILLDSIPIINEYVDHEIGVFIRGSIATSASANGEVGWVSVAQLIDPHGLFTPSNGRFTAPKKGWYHIEGYYNTNLAVNSAISPAINNTVLPVYFGWLHAASHAKFSGSLFLNGGDVVTIRPTASFSASSVGNFMSITKVN